MNDYLIVQDNNLGARTDGSKTDLAYNSTVPSQMKSDDFIRVTPIF